MNKKKLNFTESIRRRSSLTNWLLGVVFGTLFLTMISLMGGFYLRNSKRVTEKPLLSDGLLLTNNVVPSNTTDKKIVESHLFSRVKVKRGTLRKCSLHLFSLKNGGGPSLGYATKKDNATWYGADSRFAVDFLTTQNASDTHESTSEDTFLEAHGVFALVLDQAQPEPRDQKTRKQVWMIHSERKQRKQIRKRRLRPDWPELLDTSYYLKKETSSPLENGVAGGSARPLRRPFRGSFRGYAADQDGTAYAGGADFWDYFDTEKGSDHFQVFEFSEFEIRIHSMNLEELTIEQEQFVSTILEQKAFITSSEKRAFDEEDGAVVCYDYGRRKLVKKLGPNELEIQVHPQSESWELEVYTIQKSLASSIAFLSAKLKRIKEEISIRQRQLDQAEEAPDKPRIREKKNPAAMLRYKRQPGKKQLSRSQQKPIGEHDWRYYQMDDISYYRPLKGIQASPPKKTSPIFQYRNTVEVDNTLQLDFKVINNDLFDVSQESN